MLLVQKEWLMVELRRNFIYSAIVAFAALHGISGAASTKILVTMEYPDRTNNVLAPRPRHPKTSSGQ
jgi:hypothetical protein